MVNNSFTALSAFLLASATTAFLTAGEFTASVSNTKVHSKESFTLNLVLKDASPKEAPAFSVLNKDFLIHSQQYGSNTTIINGKVSSGVTWKLSLTPLAEGSVQIPAITINTTDGTLSTKPITLNVVPGSSSSSTDNGPNLITNISNPTPYKNEPFIYTALLTSKSPLYNVQTQKIKGEDAIVELLEEPKLKEKVVDGVLLNVIEFKYLVTPLKSGSLIIPSITIQGAIPQKRKEQFGPYDDYDPFNILQGFDRLKPFTLMTEAKQLDVQSPIADISPWLPAKALTIEEQWPKDQTLRVGEPFSRSITIKAEGLKASQLSNLDLHDQNFGFKVYTDKPEEQEKVVQGSIHSSRKEQYTLIPQQAGTWTLPEISIAWWDTVKKQKRISTLPARTIQILPAVETTAPSPQEMQSTPSPSIPSIEDAPTSTSTPYLLYGIIAALAISLAATLLWILALHRKIASLTQPPQVKPTEQPTAPQKKPTPAIPVIKEKKEKLPDLNPT